MKIGETKRGYYIYREPNTMIGGYDYFTDSIAGGMLIISSLTEIEEVEIALNDMKKRKKEFDESSSN